MAFYYVKSSFGTRTSAAASTTQRTGAFSAMTAADTYAKIADVMTYNTMAAGDFICCSDVHNASISANYSFDNTAGSGFYTIMSVDDANCDQYSAGAAETRSGSFYNIGGVGFTVLIKGLTFDSRDGMDPGDDSATCIFEDCTINVTYASASSDYTISAGDQHIVELRNTDLQPNNINNSLSTLINLYSGPTVRWIGGAMLATATYDINILFKYTGNNPSTVVLDGVDLSAHSGFSILGVATYGATEGCYVTLTNCKMPSSWSYTTAAIPNNGMSVRVINVDDTIKYFIGLSDFWGVSQTQATYARSGGAEVDGTGIAYEVVTNANCQDELYGHRFHLCSLSADFSTAKTVTAYMQYSSAGATDLQDDEIWIEVHVPKSGSPDMVVYKSYLDSAGQGGVLWTDAPADYANNTETWSGSLSNAVRQEMEITTAGSEDDGIAHVYIVVAKPSLTVYVDPGVDVA